MSWWDDLNRAKDEALAGLQQTVTGITGSSNDFLATVIPPSQQKATATNVSQPVAGVNLPQTSGVNNNMLIVGIAALIASLYFLKKG